MLIRPVTLPADREALLRLDTSSTSALRYRVEAAPDAFRLIEEPASPPAVLTFPLDDDLDDAGRPWGHALVADEGGAARGFIALRHEQWNRRVVIWHLYIDRAARGMGLGRRLIDAAEAYARAQGARCLALETSSANHPAIQFYRHMGFSLCGLDTSLYDPAGPAAGETALYFMRAL